MLTTSDKPLTLFVPTDKAMKAVTRVKLNTLIKARQKLEKILPISCQGYIIFPTRLLDGRGKNIEMRSRLDKGISSFTLESCQIYYATVIAQWEDGDHSWWSNPSAGARRY